MESMGQESPQLSNAPGLASLLMTGESALWGEEDLRALLHHQLATAIAGDALTFDQILTEGQGDVGSLERIKEFAKAASDDACSGIPPAVCHVLYYASIAV